MNLENANRVINYMRKRYKGVDLQIVIQGSDRIMSVFMIFIIFSLNTINRYFENKDLGHLIAGVMLFVFSIILGVYAKRLNKIRDYLIENRMQDMDEIKN